MAMPLEGSAKSINIFRSFKQLKQLGTQIQATLSRRGYKNTKLYMQGSAARWTNLKGVPFAYNRGSDFDIALTSDDIFRKAEELGFHLLKNRGISIRIPTNNDFLK